MNTLKPTADVYERAASAVKVYGTTDRAVDIAFAAGLEAGLGKERRRIAAWMRGLGAPAAETRAIESGELS